MHRVTESEKEKVVQVLSRNEENLEFISFIEGCNLDTQGILFLENENDYQNVCGIFGTWCFYGTETNSIDMLLDCLYSFSYTPQRLCTRGLQEEILQSHFEGDYAYDILCKLKRKVTEEIPSYVTRVETEENAQKVYDLLQKIPEINGGGDFPHFLHYMSYTKAYMIEEDGICISTGMVNAETDKTGIIVSVGTEEHYRGKGYASALVSKICKDMQEEKKEVYLYYDNPIAGKIYQKIGFAPIAKRISIMYPKLYQKNR